MKDDLLLSLFLDGRLPPAEAERFRRRLAEEPELSRRLGELRRLQEMSARLSRTGADFTPEQVRVRAGSRPRARRRWGLAAAAVLALAVSHGAAYLLGVYRAPPPSPIVQAERLLEEAAGLDAAAPFDRLRDRLVDLRGAMAPLPEQLARYDGSRRERRRVAELFEAFARIEVAYDQVEDPGFLGLIVREIAADSLDGAPAVGFVPANAVRYSRVVPLEGGRFRVFVASPLGSFTDEGTLEELGARHAGLRFVEESD